VKPLDSVNLVVSNYQQAVEQVERLDLLDEEITALVISIYSARAVEDSGGYDELVTHRNTQTDREQLQAAGWADSVVDGRNEELPLTEEGAAIHYYYHEVGKNRTETEKLLNEDPTEFARQAFEWWYRGNGPEAENDPGTENDPETDGD
jgi:hypothetical protein